jgi:hypothetical protein
MKRRQLRQLGKSLFQLAVEPLEDRNLLASSLSSFSPSFSVAGYKSDFDFTDKGDDWMNQPVDNITSQSLSGSTLRSPSFDSTDVIFKNFIPKIGFRSINLSSFDTSFFTFSFMMVISHDPGPRLGAAFQKGMDVDFFDRDELPRTLSQNIAASEVARTQAVEHVVHAFLTDSEAISSGGFFARHDLSAYSAPVSVRGVVNLTVSPPVIRESSSPISTERMGGGTERVSETMSPIPAADPLDTFSAPSPPPAPTSESDRAMDLANYPTRQGAIAGEPSISLADLAGTVQRLLEATFQPSAAPTDHQLFWWGMGSWVVAAGLAGEYLRRRWCRQPVLAPFEYDWLSRMSWQETL